MKVTNHPGAAAGEKGLQPGQSPDPGLLNTNPQPYAANEKWLDKQDVLEMLHISDRTLQKWRSNKWLPFSRIGKKIFYPESALKAMLVKNLRLAVLFWFNEAMQVGG
jgi:hypothetical protein